jgi:hypothetical protein
MLTLTRLLLVLASMLLGPLVVLADELPQDTNTIEKDRSANGTSASVGRAGRIMRSNRRS